MRKILTLMAVGLLAACASGNDLDRAPVPLGDFALGHNVVVAPNPVQGPLSRDATSEEWIATVKEAIDARFGRYEGKRLFHLGISIDGYVLAQPGIPIVLAPKSVVIVNVTVYEDATGEKLNAEPKQISVVESFGAGAFLGSGLTQTREEQLAGLATRAGKEIEIWLVQMNKEHGWFEPPKDASAAASTEPATEDETTVEQVADAVEETTETEETVATE